jgi:4'-phosphopantetheinyl transferase
VARILVATARVAVRSGPTWRSLEALLSPDEQGRAARFRFAEDRSEYVAAHVLLRRMLAVTRACPPTAIAFARTARGKPFVADGLGPHFSLSHSRGLVACALCEEHEVGLDVEPLDSCPPLDLAKAYFSEAERAALFALPEARQQRRFLDLWTLKEAVVKATGQGLSQGLHGFAIHFEPLAITCSGPMVVSRRPWHLYQRDVGGTHVIGLAWRGGIAEVRHLPDSFGNTDLKEGTRPVPADGGDFLNG